MNPLLIHYENLKASENHPRYDQLCNYKLLKLLFLVADILEPLKITTLTAQSNKITILHMKNVFDQQIALLRSLKTQAGTNESQFNLLLERTQEISRKRWVRSQGNERPLVYKIYGHNLSYHTVIRQWTNLYSLVN